MKNQHWNGIEGKSSQGMKVSMMATLGDLLFRIRTKSLWKNDGCKRCMMCEKGVNESGTLDAVM